MESGVLPTEMSKCNLFETVHAFWLMCIRVSSFVTAQVRVNSLVCLGKILEYLDKWFVIDEILPFLQQIPSREPAVLMGILGKKN